MVAHVDTGVFVARHRRMPNTDRVALWEFELDGKPVNVWGKWSEALATITLYLRMHDLEDAPIVLLDCSPMPTVCTIRDLES